MSKSVRTTELLAGLETQVEQHLRFSIEQLQNAPEEILSRPSATGGWSIAQCLWHLNSYGRYYLPLIERKMKEALFPVDYFTSTWLGAYFIKMMLPETGKKYKTFKDHIPPAGLNPYAEVAEFIRQQEELLRLLKIARYADLNRVRIPLSIMKWVTIRLGDVFQFIVAHDERHLQQASRNM